MLASFEKMLAAGKDSALLRYSLSKGSSLRRSMATSRPKGR
jgi:hypothetical protein